MRAKRTSCRTCCCCCCFADRYLVDLNGGLSDADAAVADALKADDAETDVDALDSLEMAEIDWQLLLTTTACNCCCCCQMNVLMNDSLTRATSWTSWTRCWMASWPLN